MPRNAQGVYISAYPDLPVVQPTNPLDRLLIPIDDFANICYQANPAYGLSAFIVISAEAAHPRNAQGVQCFRDRSYFNFTGIQSDYYWGNNVPFSAQYYDFDGSAYRWFAAFPSINDFINFFINKKMMQKGFPRDPIASGGYIDPYLVTQAREAWTERYLNSWFKLNLSQRDPVEYDRLFPQKASIFDTWAQRYYNSRGLNVDVSQYTNPIATNQGYSAGFTLTDWITPDPNDWDRERPSYTQPSAQFPRGYNTGWYSSRDTQVGDGKANTFIQQYFNPESFTYKKWAAAQPSERYNMFSFLIELPRDIPSSYRGFENQFIARHAKILDVRYRFPEISVELEEVVVGVEGTQTTTTRREERIKKQEKKNKENLLVVNQNSIPKEKTKFRDYISGILLNMALELIRLYVTSLRDMITQYSIDAVQDRVGDIEQLKEKYCPTPEALNELITKRNNLVNGLNKVGDRLEALNVTVDISVLFGTSLTTIATALTKAKNLLNTGLGILPVASGRLTAGINTLSSIADAIKFNDQGQPTLPPITITASQISPAVALVQEVIATCVELLGKVDVLINLCKDTPSSTLPEVSGLVGRIANLSNVGENVNDSTYVGFIIEIEEKNYTPTVKQYRAVGKNSSGVVLITTDWSFSTNQQVLIDELKFIIDRDNLKAY